MITIATNTNRPQMYDYILNNIIRQETRPDLVILVVPPEHNPSRLVLSLLSEVSKNVQVIFEPTQVLGNLQFRMHELAEKLMDTGIVIKMEDDDYYGEKYITEQAECFMHHPDAGMVGKVPYNVRWDEGRGPTVLRGTDVKIDNNGRCHWVCGGSICINIDVWRAVPKFRHRRDDVYGDASVIQAANDNNVPIYTTGPGNYFYGRWTAPGHNHIWDEPAP